MKSSTYTLLCLILHILPSLSSTIDCNYRDGSFITVGRIYQCVVDNDPNITTQKSSQIDSFNGPHQRNKNDTDVHGFYAGRKAIQHFPKGLEKFPNLKSIQILNCQLKELHQSHLKPFVDLILIYMESNLIEVLEEGLFAYNLKLTVIGFANNKIVHIDANVFDHLTQLSDFLFKGVPCIDLTIYSSVDKVKDAVKVIKTKCVSSEFNGFVDKVVKLEDQANSLGTEELDAKLKNLENELKNSKFSGFRPISSKFEQLINLRVKDNQTSDGSTSSSDQMTPINSEICSKSDQFLDLDEKFSNFSSQMTAIMSNKLSDIKSSIDNLEVTQKSSQKAILDTTTSTISSELKTTQESIKSLRDEVKEAVSDSAATISDVKINQIDIQGSLSKLKTTQNDLKVSMNDLKALVMKSDGKLESFEENFVNFEENFVNFEEKFVNFEAKVGEKFDKIEKSLNNVGHKMEIKLDEKVKGIEKRLMKKFEEMLQENLGKILEEKLNKMMNGRIGD